MEPFKNLFNHNLIKQMAMHLHRVWPEFDVEGYCKLAGQNLEQNELKQRIDQIMCALKEFLPDSFPDAAKVIIDSLHMDDDVDLSNLTMDDQGIRGWACAPICHYVGVHGLDDFDLGMTVEYELTKRFTSEYGIRFFILHDQARAFATLQEWAKDGNYHVRRLVSEGSRPRLPWAMQFPELIKDPAPILPLLEMLRDDPSEYVRRSVANNLNDIAKDHPDVVAGIAGKWLGGATPAREKLVRHACRTLIKQGHEQTLRALGYGKPEVTLKAFSVITPVIKMGVPLQFDMTLNSITNKDQNLMIDYVIHHRKANGKTTPKVFKWKNSSLKAGKPLSAQRNHPIKPITTRVYYPGLHHVEIMINGQSFGVQDFELVMTD